MDWGAEGSPLREPGRFRRLVRKAAALRTLYPQHVQAPVCGHPAGKPAQTDTAVPEGETPFASQNAKSPFKLDQSNSARSREGALNQTVLLVVSDDSRFTKMQAIVCKRSNAAKSIPV